MRTMQDVQSSMVSQVGSDGEDLIVRFAKSGKLYRYKNAAQHLDDCVKAPSVGQYINGFIKQNFEATQETL